jgi:uncharacterized phage infection (PIP) family protein YhgE
LGGESLEFLPSEKARYLTPTDVVTPDPKGEHWDSFRMSDYMALQLETLSATEDSLTGIEQGLLFLSLHQQYLRAALTGVQASGVVSRQVIEQLDHLDEVARDLQRRSQGVAALATALEQTQHHLPSPTQTRQTLAGLQQPLTQASAKVTSPDTTRQLRALNCRLQQMVDTLNQTTRQWGSPSSGVAPMVQQVPGALPAAPLCQD